MRGRKGFILVMVLAFLFLILAISLAGVRVVSAIHMALWREEARTICLHAAEGGAELALARLRKNPAYRGEEMQIGKARVRVIVKPSKDGFVVSSLASLRRFKAEVRRGVKVKVNASLDIVHWEEVVEK